MLMYSILFLPGIDDIRIDDSIGAVGIIDNYRGDSPAYRVDSSNWLQDASSV